MCLLVSLCLDIYAYKKFQNAEVFNWTCPGCLSNTLPFHDCSVLSSPSFPESDVAGHCKFVELPLLSSSGLRVACLNCRSLLSITDEVFDLLISNHVDIFAVTETRLDPSISDSEIFSYSLSNQYCAFRSKSSWWWSCFPYFTKSQVCGEK